MVLHPAEDPAAMLAEMARVVKSGDAVAITDEVEHPFTWMCEQHADVGLDILKSRGKEFLREAAPSSFDYESLGMQRRVLM